MTNRAFEEYEKEIAVSRANFIQRVIPLTAEIDPRTLMAFWINFCSLGVGMTESVEDWIRCSGERTRALGYEKLGVKLIKHSTHEKDHHLMMIKDTHKLVAMWNKNYVNPILDAAQLLTRKPMNSTLAYSKLHTDTIEGDSPFAQIAIEYEIEMLSTTVGPVILKNAVHSLGQGIKTCLTFVSDHVLIDQAHTKYNRATISEFLTEFPSTLKKLVEVGSSALKIYGTFLIDCLECVEFCKV